MHKHELTLLGRHGALRVPADTLLDAVGALLEGARQATRFLVDGESTRKGPRPAWLDSACRIEITGLTAGSAVVAMQAPTLEEAAPERFAHGAQAAGFDGIEASIAKRTAVDLFGHVIANAMEGSTEHVLADRTLLDTCARFARAAGTAFEGIALGGLAGRTSPLVIRAEDAPRIERLRDETPSAQAVRITGTLDTISATRSDVVLTLASGDKVAARLEAPDPATLKDLFGAHVVVSGMARFRPNGRVLMIAVEHIAEASETDALFATLPVATEPLVIAPVVAQDEESGVSAFFGRWPGDETDEELLAALEAVG